MTTEQLCTNCGCTNPQKTYDGYWCKMCKHEMSDTNQQRHRDDFGTGQSDTVKRLWLANTSREIQAILMEYAKSLLDENATLRARIAELEQPTPVTEPEFTTVLGWLQRLPDGYRERAIGQYNSKFWPTDEPIYTIDNAISRFGLWNKTNEGATFWHQVCDHYLQGTPLPPLPI
jgi:hypothetical protein